MLNFPDISPVAFQLGPLAVHWYGLMYLIGFAGCWGVIALRLKATPRDFSIEQLSDILFYVALGVIIGGRLGYMIFYDFHDVIYAPWRIFMVWLGGMSFHGGLIGVFLAVWIYAYKNHRAVLDVTDLIAPAIPLGLAAGRIGNFINSELWGRVTDVPWAMLFPNGGDLPRHPSQLYEFFLEGVVMFIILWLYSAKPRPTGAVSGLFLILYGVFRIIIEFFREPDAHIGYLAFGWLTEGQLLSLPMIILGSVLVIYAYRGIKQCNNI